VNGGDTVFIGCVSVCLSECVSVLTTDPQTDRYNKKA